MAGGRFATAGFTDEPERLTGFHMKAHAIHGLDGALAAKAEEVGPEVVNL
jgi:hypothetical protein